MDSVENEGPSQNKRNGILDEPSPSHADFISMQEFMLYSTRSNFYMIGINENKEYWKVLKIDRMDVQELNLREDCTVYTKNECFDLLRRIHEGNKATGGLKFVTHCYGIVGFIKFLGPYYMIIITKRRQIGAICGHNVYAVSKTEIIPLSNPDIIASPDNTKDENRYKKLLQVMDLTKDFFFSYSYNVMRSLQKNVLKNESGHILYETMFVWNEFLTRKIRCYLQNTEWTVALVYGFFKQASLSVSGRDIKITLIARRSRHYAGTRYLKRGVNEKGRVANDVETEQIVYEDIPDGSPLDISSVVQNRGSIPLFWSQETSRLNLKPDIILSRNDHNYEATKLHFDNLVKRYGNPVIILNLIKSQEKRPRESILRSEFAAAIDLINKDLSEDDRLKFLHWDLHKHSRSNATNVLLLLGKVAAYALTLTGFFYCHVAAALTPVNTTTGPAISRQNSEKENGKAMQSYEEESLLGNVVDVHDARNDLKGNYASSHGNHCSKPVLFQTGVLRTNCIDCLDRTNVAQFAYGLVALGNQLQILGILENSKIDLDSSLANELMSFYERMGDTLAHQYGGSAAHNKIFSKRRGQWTAATQSQEFFRTLQRHYNNAYLDAEKQSAIDLFLGHIHPEDGKSAPWELNSSQNGGSVHTKKDDIGSHIIRSFSDGNVIRGSNDPLRYTNCSTALPGQLNRDNKEILDFSPDIPTSDSDTSFSRYTATMPRRQPSEQDKDIDSDNVSTSEHGEVFNFSNFVDEDWLSSRNSLEEDPGDRSLLHSMTRRLSSENCMNEITCEALPSTSECGGSSKALVNGAELCYGNAEGSNRMEDFDDGFVNWINHGETLCH